MCHVTIFREKKFTKILLYPIYKKKKKTQRNSYSSKKYSILTTINLHRNFQLKLKKKKEKNI